MVFWFQAAFWLVVLGLITVYQLLRPVLGWYVRTAVAVWDALVFLAQGFLRSYRFPDESLPGRRS